jgi:hypothetical protein
MAGSDQIFEAFFFKQWLDSRAPCPPPELFQWPKFFLGKEIRLDWIVMRNRAFRASAWGCVLR